MKKEIKKREGLKMNEVEKKLEQAKRDKTLAIEAADKKIAELEAELELKRNCENLEEFEVSGQYDQTDKKTFTGNISTNSKIWMHILTCGSHFDIAEATEIHQKLGQLIATAQRQTENQHKDIKQ